jgi:CHAD domain-containing protein
MVPAERWIIQVHARDIRSLVTLQMEQMERTAATELTEEEASVTEQQYLQAIILPMASQARMEPMAAVVAAEEEEKVVHPVVTVMEAAVVAVVVEVRAVPMAPMEQEEGALLLSGATIHRLRLNTVI